MKANEAPEKIYIPTILVANTVRYKEEGAIEYVRKDAFIEKACSYIRLYSALLDTENNDCMPEWLDKFRNAMKK